MVIRFATWRMLVKNTKTNLPTRKTKIKLIKEIVRNATITKS